MVSRLCENYLIRKFSNLVIEGNHKSNINSILIEKWEHSKSKNDLFPISHHQEQVLFVPAEVNLEFQRIHGFQDPTYLRNTAVSSNEILILCFPRHPYIPCFYVLCSRKIKIIFYRTKRKERKKIVSFILFFSVVSLTK